MNTLVLIGLVVRRGRFLQVGGGTAHRGSKIVGLPRHCRPERPPSVTSAPELNFRHGKSVPESYGIDELRDAWRRRQSRSPEQAGSSPAGPFLKGSVVGLSHAR